MEMPHFHPAKSYVLKENWSFVFIYNSLKQLYIYLYFEEYDVIVYAFVQIISISLLFSGDIN